MNLLPEKHFALPAVTVIHLLHDTRKRTLALFEDLDEAEWRVQYLEIINLFRWELEMWRFLRDVYPQMLDTRTDYGGRRKFLRFVQGRPCGPLVIAPAVATANSGVHPSRGWRRALNVRTGTHPPLQKFVSICCRCRTRTCTAKPPRICGRRWPTHSRNGERVTLPATSGGGPLPGDVEIPGGTFYLGATPDVPLLFDNESGLILWKWRCSG